MIELFAPIALEYINTLHFLFLLTFAYAAISFYRDWWCGENGLTLALALFMTSLALGEVWSLVGLLYLGPGAHTRFWRAVQLSLVLVAIINLIIQHYRIARIEPNEQNQKPGGRQRSKSTPISRSPKA